MQDWCVACTYSHLTMSNSSDLFSTGSQFRGGGSLSMLLGFRNYCFLAEFFSDSLTLRKR